MSGSWKVVLPVSRLMDRFKTEAPLARTRERPERLSTIPADARRCGLRAIEPASVRAARGAAGGVVAMR